MTASYGLILRNRSYGKDAVNIDVRVSALDALGRTAADDDEYVMLIPAGQSFNVGNELIASVSVKVARLRVSVTVGRWLPKGQRLPSVTGTELSQANNEISGFVRNPYSKSIPDGASIFAVFLNGPGRIVGGFSDWIGARVLPRQSTSYCIYPLYMPGDAASALVSVNPCDDLALVCAIRGAQ